MAQGAGAEIFVLRCRGGKNNAGFTAFLAELFQKSKITARSGVKGKRAISGQANTPNTAFQAGVTGSTGPLKPPASRLRIIR